MEGRTKVTKEVLCEESRFILANVMAEARYGRQNRYDDIRRVCEGAVSIPFSEYISFLSTAGYLAHDRSTETLEVTANGEKIVNGGNLSELTERAVAHFKNVRAKRRREVQDSSVSVPLSSGGRASATVGGEIQNSSELLDSRYEKLATIGSGGVGTVYRARQVPLNREVALKEIRDLFGFFSEAQRGEIVRRFTDVVRAAAGLAHPNILPIHDVNLDREFPYLVSELAPNGSARRLISDAEHIPVSLGLKYLLQSLHALRAAHTERVIHRGLKPENLLIDGYGNVKISDFGFTRIVERDNAAARSRQFYVGMGNIAYMAPELYSDPHGAGPQADIYAMGIIFYELLTRKLPGRRCLMPTEVNARLPKGIDDIFDRMTRDSRTERYTSVDDILDDLHTMEGLSEVLEQQDAVLVADNPLDKIEFRGDEAGEQEVSTTGTAPAAPTADAAESSSTNGESSDKKDEDKDDKKGSGPSHRPYSFQQRKKR
jgi:serine/threonine protein kinase